MDMDTDAIDLRLTEAQRAQLAAFGQRVKQLRQQHELTQQRVAERSEFAKIDVAAIERGNFNPSLLQLYVLADALEVPPAAFFEEN